MFLMTECEISGDLKVDHPNHFHLDDHNLNKGFKKNLNRSLTHIFGVGRLGLNFWDTFDDFGDNL